MYFDYSILDQINNPAVTQHVQVRRIFKEFDELRLAFHFWKSYEISF